ncbi:MAG: DUF2628 domain-containing protein [Alphaproteobacteria bacterium]
MKTYNVYIKAKSKDNIDDLILVKEGFNWYCLNFSGLWAIYKAVWSVLLAYIVATFAGIILVKLSILSNIGMQIFSLITSVMISFHANDLYGRSLVKRGYKLRGISIGKSYDEALLRFIDKNT